MRHLILLAAFFTLPACIGGADCDGDIISVSTSHTSTEGGLVSTDACMEAVNNGYDASACCPEGYAFLAMESSSSVLCEEQCGIVDDKSVASAGATAFIVHAATDAAFDAVEELATNAPPQP